MEDWVEQEVLKCDFPDQRLKSRLGKLLRELGRRIGETVPTACQDWAATKAAYRFFSNPRVDESLILAGGIDRRADVGHGREVLLDHGKVSSGPRKGFTIEMKIGI